MAYDVRKLPRDLLQRLDAAGRGASTDEYPALSCEGTLGKWFLLVPGLVLAAGPCFYIYDYWRMLPLDEMIGCTLACSLGMWMVASAVGRLVRYYRASPRPVMVLGKDSLAVVEEVGGAADIVPLASIEKILVRNASVATVRFKDLPDRIYIPTASGPPVVGFFEEVLKRRLAALQNPLPEDSPESWKAAAERARAAYPATWSPPTLWGRHLAVLATGLGLAAAAIFLTWRQVGLRIAVERFESARESDTVKSWKSWLEEAMHASRVLAPAARLPFSVKGKYPYGRDYTHVMLRTTPFEANLVTGLARYEELCLQEALGSGAAKPLREYLEDFPAPAFRAEAEAALRKLYQQAEARYLDAAAAQSVSPAAREGMQALLHALASDHVTAEKVGVSFLPVAGLEGGAIEESVRQATGATTVYPVGPSFTKAANEARHSRIVSSFNQGLSKVVGDLFELEERPLEAPGPRILVGYTVKPSGAHFYSKSQEELPMAKRDLYVGIVVLFSCTIQTPPAGEVAPQDPAQGHAVGILATPAPNFSVSASRHVSMQQAVYDRMAETAFDEFAKRVAQTYGIGALGGG